MYIALYFFTQWKHKEDLSYNERDPNVDLVIAMYHCQGQWYERRAYDFRSQ